MSVNESNISDTTSVCDPCTCLIKHPASLEEEEPPDEIDPDELVEDIPETEIWQKISDHFDAERKRVQDYKLSSILQVPPNPPIAYLEKEIFPHLVTIMEDTVFQAEKICLKYEKSVFNAIDVISEMLWNLNPRHPERKLNWTFRFDMEWVNEWLEKHPRPYFPLSWLWTDEYAATKIQAVVRAHWVRREPDVQEMRQFWIEYKKDKREKLASEEMKLLDEEEREREMAIFEEMLRRRCMPKIKIPKDDSV